MAQSSLGFTTDGTGDGTATGYTSAQFQAYMRSLWIDDGDLDEQGVIYGQGNGLEVTVTGAGASQVDTGSALVYGIWYENTAAVAVAHTTPLIDTTGWRIVLRASWAAGTVRVTLVESADGVAAIPALTQVAGTTWDIPLAQGTITVGDVVTIASDDRKYIKGTWRRTRARTFIVQVDGAYNETDGTRINRNDSRGFAFADSKRCGAYGSFGMPGDYVSSMNVYPLFISAGAGDIFAGYTISYGAQAEDYDNHSDSDAVGAALTMLGADKINLPIGINLTAQAAGDYVQLYEWRDATNIADTENATVYFVGWMVAYTAED